MYAFTCTSDDGLDGGFFWVTSLVGGYSLSEMCLIAEVASTSSAPTSLDFSMSLLINLGLGLIVYQGTLSHNLPIQMHAHVPW